MDQTPQKNIYTHSKNFTVLVHLFNHRDVNGSPGKCSVHRRIKAWSNDQSILRYRKL